MKYCNQCYQNLGCASRFLFQFQPSLIFRNPSVSLDYFGFCGTHVGIKPFQGKINLFRNPPESDIPAGFLEGRTLSMPRVKNIQRVY